MKKCPNCGEEYRFMHSCPRTCVYCGDCFNRKLGLRMTENGKDFHWKCKKREIQKKRLCSNCAFFETKESINDIWVDEFGTDVTKKREHYCRKLKIRIRIPPSQCLILPEDFDYGGEEAERCTHFVNYLDYKEKALNGEIQLESENEFYTCTYCNTKYNKKITSICPKCGAS